MQYVIRSLSGQDCLETVEGHVLARAYQSAWRALHGHEPVGKHVIPELDLIIEYFEGATGLLH